MILLSAFCRKRESSSKTIRTLPCLSPITEATAPSWPNPMATMDDGPSGVSFTSLSSISFSRMSPSSHPRPPDGRMQVDYSIELGADDPALEFPWASDDGRVSYYDLKQHPDLVLNIEEAREHPELSEFLSRINAASSPLQTAKCDAWSTHELSPEEEIFGASCKFACYVDLLFLAKDFQTSL